jgi:hypothetical protein
LFFGSGSVGLKQGPHHSALVLWRRFDYSNGGNGKQYFAGSLVFRYVARRVGFALKLLITKILSLYQRQCQAARSRENLLDFLTKFVT